MRELQARDQLTSTKKHKRQIELHQQEDTLWQRLWCQVEARKRIGCEAISATLTHNHFRPERLSHSMHHSTHTLHTHVQLINNANVRFPCKKLTFRDFTKFVITSLKFSSVHLVIKFRSWKIIYWYNHPIQQIGISLTRKYNVCRHSFTHFLSIVV